MEFETGIQVIMAGLIPKLLVTFHSDMHGKAPDGAKFLDGSLRSDSWKGA